MKNLLFPSLLVIFAVLAAAPAVAQTRSTLSPTTLPHIANPGISLTAPATSPLQAQMQDDYATQLKGEQFQLMQQNPSGVTRPEMGINRALNGFTPQ